jgi:hypothetical protein
LLPGRGGGARVEDEPSRDDREGSRDEEHWNTVSSSRDKTVSSGHPLTLPDLHLHLQIETPLCSLCQSLHPLLQFADGVLSQLILGISLSYLHSNGSHSSALSHPLAVSLPGW